MTELKTWVRDNSTLVYFLIAQALAIGAAGASVLAYMVKLETRVSIMETRGAAYTVERMAKMDDKITILQQQSEANTQRLERIIDIMTKKLNINPQ